MCWALTGSRFESLITHETGPTVCRARLRFVRHADGSRRISCDISSYFERLPTLRVCATNAGSAGDVYAQGKYARLATTGERVEPEAGWADEMKDMVPLPLAFFKLTGSRAPV
jgi:hypothetical protein